MDVETTEAGSGKHLGRRGCRPESREAGRRRRLLPLLFPLEGTGPNGTWSGLTLLRVASQREATRRGKPWGWVPQWCASFALCSFE